MLAVGQRDARIGSAGERGRDTRYDLVSNAVTAQVFEFFAAAAEYEGIAALQPHDATPALHLGDHQSVDTLLPRAMATRCLANVDDLGIPARAGENLA